MPKTGTKVHIIDLACLMFTKFIHWYNSMNKTNRELSQHSQFNTTNPTSWNGFCLAPPDPKEKNSLQCHLSDWPSEKNKNTFRPRLFLQGSLDYQPKQCTTNGKNSSKIIQIYHTFVVFHSPQNRTLFHDPWPRRISNRQASSSLTSIHCARVFGTWATDAQTKEGSQKKATILIQYLNRKWTIWTNHQFSGDMLVFRGGLINNSWILKHISTKQRPKQPCSVLRKRKSQSCSKKQLT